MPEPTPQEKSASTTPVVTTATVENRDADGHLQNRQLLEVKSEFGNTPQGVIANIWSKLGMLAAVVIAFFGMMGWFAFTIKSVADDAREEAREVRKTAEQERKDNIDRYIASRTANDTRHQEVLAKLDKLIIFTDLWFKYLLKEAHTEKGSFSTSPPTIKKIMEK